MFYHTKCGINVTLSSSDTVIFGGGTIKVMGQGEMNLITAMFSYHPVNCMTPRDLQPRSGHQWLPSCFANLTSLSSSSTLHHL